MDFDGAKQFVLQKLKKELNHNLTYHSVGHTKDVMKSAERLARMEGLKNGEICLLKTAALFHDMGFLKVYDGHEKASMEFASEILPRFGYSKDDIEIIRNLIKATEIPQSPKNHLEEILADADLDYIGRDDLFIIGQRLHYEWYQHGKVNSLREWHEKQLNFLKKHHFFTATARATREQKKQENIKEIETLLCIPGKKD